MTITLAFTSCAEASQRPEQPIWDRIAAAHPDHLVLLGDTVYYDNWDGANMGWLQDMSAHDFAVHAHARWQRQLDVPGFRALVGQVRTHAIWDDHDFLWNNACGAQAQAAKVYAGHLGFSRCLFQAFRAELARPGGPGNMPPLNTFDQTKPPEIGLGDAVDLGEGVQLHLTDGRGFKTTGGHKALLGATQLNLLRERMTRGGALHLIASGVVFESDALWKQSHDKGETWADCPSEHDALLDTAARCKALMLSGDIHRNRLARYGATGKWLYEATASGAALVDFMMPEAQGTRDHWGLLRIGADRIEIELRHSQGITHRAMIDRTTWDWKVGPSL
ncbi:alkaline phosphatase D family protein [Pseudacidovorax sp. RU35E]|uniref:alkaline phosphatase D family protein n=1 Tax=Pseudacidovorax sp. RU35E TaxID=1907403 RepID=UPI000955A968|nr:alkaline phosphatase D family protein [Pseudacidovorax sp. RU35E]SIQ36139.1 PhoD-like phosphatase [Pseudacidovorax sp. RU35E]